MIVLVVDRPPYRARTDTEMADYAMVESAILLSALTRYSATPRCPTMKCLNDLVMLWRAPVTKETRSLKKNQKMSTNFSAVAVFHTHAKAEDAVRELRKSGFNMTKLSIVDSHF